MGRTIKNEFETKMFYLRGISQNNNSIFCIIICFLPVNLFHEHCFKESLVSECVLKCSKLNYHVYFETDLERCCCEINKDSGTCYEIIRGNVFFSLVVTKGTNNNPP